jgi:hypothetical protein
MRSIRKRLTYANVMSSIAVFIVLGGAAFAASKLPKKSVGTPQLKANAVTTAKIKKNAVTSKKIKDGTVNVKDVNVESMPFGRVVTKMRTGGPLSIAEAELRNYPLSPSTYAQGAEENDSYVGAVDVTFEPTCEAPRSATALIAVDAPNPTILNSEEEEDIVSAGVVSDEKGGTVSKRIQISPFIFFGSKFEPGTTLNHAVNLVLIGHCKAGTGINATTGAVDVIGTK